MDKEYKLIDLSVQSGYYELSIQVCPTVYPKGTEDFVNYFLSQKNITVERQEKNFNCGRILFKEKKMPYQFFISTHLDELGINYYWISILFMPQDIENVFGSEYEVWAVEPNVPKELDIFLENLAYQFYLFYPFKLGMIGFEVRTSYSINLLHNKIEGDCYAKCFTGIEHYKYIHPDNQKWVTLWMDNKTKNAGRQNRILTGVSWCFSKTAYENAIEFEKEIEKYNSNVNIENIGWNANAICIAKNEIGIAYNHWKGNDEMEYSFLKLKANSEAGFTTLDLMFQLQYHLAGVDFGDHVFFEGLNPIENADSNSLPSYLLKCGS
jgi:hypothetical protein